MSNAPALLALFSLLSLAGEEATKLKPSRIHSVSHLSVGMARGETNNTAAADGQRTVSTCA